MVHHAEASRLNIERMKQIYQQLSCYRGLGKDNTGYKQLQEILQAFISFSSYKKNPKLMWSCICINFWLFFVFRSFGDSSVHAHW